MSKQINYREVAFNQLSAAQQRAFFKKHTRVSERLSINFSISKLIEYLKEFNEKYLYATIGSEWFDSREEYFISGYRLKTDEELLQEQKAAELIEQTKKKQQDKIEAAELAELKRLKAKYDK